MKTVSHKGDGNINHRPLGSTLLYPLSLGLLLLMLMPLAYAQNSGDAFDSLAAASADAANETAADIRVEPMVLLDNTGECADELHATGITSEDSVEEVADEINAAHEAGLIGRVGRTAFGGLITAHNFIVGMVVSLHPDNSVPAAKNLATDFSGTVGCAISNTREGIVMNFQKGSSDPAYYGAAGSQLFLTTVTMNEALAGGFAIAGAARNIISTSTVVTRASQAFTQFSGAATAQLSPAFAIPVINTAAIGAVRSADLARILAGPMLASRSHGPEDYPSNWAPRAADEAVNGPRGIDAVQAARHHYWRVEQGWSFRNSLRSLTDQHAPIEFHGPGVLMVVGGIAGTFIVGGAVVDLVSPDSGWIQSDDNDEGSQETQPKSKPEKKHRYRFR